MSASVLTLEQLQGALARCMEAHPPQGLERALHSDADQLAGLWGLMIYDRSADISVDQVAPEVMDVYRRWQDS